jgi:hypothetical protein
MHQISQQHIDSVEALENLTNVDEILDEQLLDQRAKNRKCFMKVLQTVKLLCQRNISLYAEDTKDSNVYHFVKARALDDPDLMLWIEKKRGCYLCHQVITEIVHLMAIQVLDKNILSQIQKGNVLKFSYLLSNTKNFALASPIHFHAE